MRKREHVQVEMQLEEARREADDAMHAASQAQAVEIDTDVLLVQLQDAEVCTLFSDPPSPLTPANCPLFVAVCKYFKTVQSICR